MFRTVTLIITFSVAASFLIGCKARLIPNSSVRDTSENRAIIKFLDEFKKALEAHSVPDMMALIAPDFYETAGTPDPQDDYGYDQLEKKLTETFAHLKTVGIRFFVQKIERRGEFIDVFYYFNEHVLAEFPSGEEWIAANDVNRLVLRPQGKKSKDGYKIVSGL